MKLYDDIKFNLNERLTSTGVVGIYNISDESKVRIVIENAGNTNSVIVSGRIKGQNGFAQLRTLSGSANESINVLTYDEIKIECVTYSSLSDHIQLLTSSFNKAGGSAIEEIGVPSGDNLVDFDTFSFTSEDESVIIVGDNTVKTIDFSVNPQIGAVISVNGMTGAVILDKEDIGLSNVDNTSDLDKPISTATQDALDLKYDASNPDGFITISDVHVLSVNTYTGDVFLNKSDIGLSNVDNTSDLDKPISTATQDALDLKYDVSNPAGYITLAEVPTAPVTSVNTYTGDVVLTKSDVGLSNVDNTSDLDKPISTASQNEFNSLNGRVDNLEEINSVQKYHAFEDNLQVYADNQPGVKDPSVNIYSNGLVRDGWYFKNSVVGQKINWYFFDGTTQGTITLGNFSAYAVMTFDATTAYPILAVYTFPTGSGDIIPGFAHSKVVYANPLTPAAVAGVKYLVYFGDEPAAHPELPRIQLTYSSISSGGDRNPAEIVLTSSFGSDSAEPVNEVKFLIETLGVNSPTVKQEMDLRIKPSIQSDFYNHITNTSNPHSVTKTQIGLSNVDNTSDLNKPISTATQNALNLITNVNWTGDYDNGRTYIVGDGVMFNGASFRMINFIGAAGYPPPAYPGSWLQVTDYVSPNDIGLGNVDNTSDLDKPISTATQTALDGKANTSHDQALDTITQSGASNGEVPIWNGLAWVPGIPTATTSWGDISGLLSDQTDLQTALDGKFDDPTGTASQYIRGDGTLSTFPSNTGGGSSVRYYLNGSVNQGTIGGNTYYQMSTIANTGTGADFVLSTGTGPTLIAEFLTDVGDPGLLKIPSGNFNCAFYFSASSSGGTPTFAVELYKYNGSTFTLISSNLAQSISNGTAIDIYTCSVSVAETNLLITDRLAIRVYVTRDGRTITLHTQNSHLSQIETTFSTGLHALNGLTEQVQYFETGTSGSDFNISSISDTHTFNIPTASDSIRGALSSTDWSTFNNKANALPTDISHTSFSGVNNQSTPANITGLVFSHTSVRSAKVQASISIHANTSLYEIVELDIINKDGSFSMNTSGTGDNCLITLSIDNNGQVQYTSSNYSGFVTLEIKFRALTTSV